MSTSIRLYSLEDAIVAFSAGKFVLIHDDKGRENEVDMVIAAEFVTPMHVGIMRRNAGGLICAAITHGAASKLGLMYMHDILEQMSTTAPNLSNLVFNKAPYGDRSAFSISVNHRDTYTGITDYDRALTINGIADVCRNIDSDGQERFSNSFRAPGHVPILIASKGLLHHRIGHTELCMYLAQVSGHTHSVVMCEMLDINTHRALTIDGAQKYARENNILILEGSQLTNYAKAV
ncbi:MAG: 3,4-dihydroxy-2-butanone-4-phosphate synthase [Nitrososphaeraceae archaeon]